MKSCTGRILEVDLTTGETRARQIPDAVYEAVLSGKGLAAWYLNRHIPADADPLGPDNILGFVSGALTGTGALMCGRWMAVGKSPLTGGWGDANCGGYFSPAIKQCGYDGIFFKGTAPKPVYLYVDNTKTELRDAAPYWGLDATEAEERLTADNWTKKKPAVALIGQAGEKISLIAGICNEAGRIAARSGLGAVMGSKRLKAVVLAGSKPMPVADRDAVNALSLKLGTKLKKANLPGFIKGGVLGFGGTVLGKLPVSVAMDGAIMMPMFKKWGSTVNDTMAINSGDGPIKNWSGGPKDAPGSVRAYNPDRVSAREFKKYHCYACGLGCGGVLDTKGLGDYAHTHRPEYETLQAFGPLLLNNNLDSVLIINELLNRAGMDSISAGNTVAWAIECFEAGILTPEMTDGLILKWGNADGIVALVKKMIAREGFGDLLADGVQRASARFGGEDCAMHIGGQEPGMHDSRNDPQLAVHFVAEPAPGKHTIGMTLGYGTHALADFVSWAPPLTMRSKAEDLIPSDHLALRSVANACFSMVVDGAGGCYYGMMFGLHSWNPFLYLNAAAGWDYDGDHYMEIGRRIQTLRQLFNIKHGIDPALWKLPKRMAGEPPLATGPLKGVTLQNDEAVRMHWAAFGWDQDTGVPTADTIDALNINELLAMSEVE